MATLRLIEGFEVAANTTNLVARYGALSGVGFVAGRTFGTALEITNDLAVVTVVPSLGMSAPDASAVAGVALWPRDIVSQPIIEFRRGGSEQCSVWLVRETASAFHLEFRVGMSTYGASESLPTEHWYYLEARVFVSNTVGTAEIRLDQAPVIEIQGVDTQAAGLSGVDSIAFRGQVVTGGALRLDDVYLVTGTGGVDDPGFFGDTKTMKLAITGDGAFSEWTTTPGGAANSSAVDDATPDDDTSYIEAVDDNETSTFKVAQVDQGNAHLRGTILGQVISARTRDDAALGAQYRIILVDPMSGDEIESDNITAGGSYGESRLVLSQSAHGLPIERQDLKHEIGVRAI